MDQNCRLGISLHAKKVPSTSTLFQFNSILFQCLSCLVCAQFAWTASKYKFISTMSSIQDAQQSVTVRFSFLACFTWCTTAPKVDPPIHFLIIWSAHNLLIAAPASQHREFYFGSYRPLHFCHFAHAWVLLSGHVSFPMSHSFAIFPFQYALAGSVEWPTSTFLVAWLEHNFAFLLAWRTHNLLIAWLAYHLTEFMF